MVSVGRTPDNDVVLNYPMVSGKHARVTVAGGRAEIEDLGSSNGIAIGDPNNRVRRAPFSASDVLFFGSLRIPGSRLLGGAVGQAETSTRFIEVQGREDAWSTDLNVYIVPVSGGTPIAITAANRGADQNPVYSPDGHTIIYASQARPGFESDRQRLMAYDRASRTSRELLPSWDRNADAYAFSPRGDAIYINSVDASRTKIYRITRTGSGWTSPPRRACSGWRPARGSSSRCGAACGGSRRSAASPAPWPRT